MTVLPGCRAVCFDLDGTLIDSYEAIAASVNHVRTQHRLGPLSIMEIKNFVGRGPNYLLEHTLPDFRGEPDLVSYRGHHPSVMLEKTVLLPGAAEGLQALHGLDKLLALCSNKPRQFSRAILQHLKIERYFTVVLGPEDVERIKPAPDMLLCALARLGVSPSEALYVGDMTVDIACARAAGVSVWAVATGSDDAAALAAVRPDRILSGLGQLIEAEGPDT
ncbi:MAG: HAD-IA family hydrolase [Planctomycetes bacterium]|nr:HAD-IA family hydrolase [Planctomycetota bacterium]